VAAISVVNHSDDMAFLGLYLCLPEWRGKGIGKALWDHAIKHAGTRSIGLDGVPDQQANYEASGFAITSQTTRYTGKVPKTDRTLNLARAADLEWMIAKERDANGYGKPAFLTKWLARSESRKTFVLQDQGGFATARRCRTGAKVGPLVAKDAQGAQTLLRAAGQAFAGPVSIDLPRGNSALAAFCIASGMAPDFATARMYLGKAPTPGSTHRAIATMELG